MREKLLQLMKNEGLTSSRLAEILEIQPSGISHILSGRNKPGFDLLQKILRRFPRINPDWLLLDSEKMYRNEESTLRSGAGSSSGALGSPGVSGANIQEVAGQHGLFDLTPSDTSAAASAAMSLPVTNATSEGVAVKLCEATVHRVIVCYDDRTFESFQPRTQS